MGKPNTTRSGIILAGMAGLVLSTGTMVLGGTVTVVNISQNGPSDRMDSGTTPETLFRADADSATLAGKTTLHRRRVLVRIYHIGSGLDSIAPGESMSANGINTPTLPPTNPIPEPATLTLMAVLGLTTLGMKRGQRA